NESRLQQPDYRRQHALTRKRWAIEIALHESTDSRQHTREINHSLVLVCVTHFSPARVVAVLLAAASIAASCLDVTVLQRTDPDITPGRRNHYRGDPPERALVADQRAI